MQILSSHLLLMHGSFDIPCRLRNVFLIVNYAAWASGVIGGDRLSPSRGLPKMSRFEMNEAWHGCVRSSALSSELGVRDGREKMSSVESRDGW